MAITTYSELKAAIADWSHRDDLNALLDTFIDLVEAEFWNKLRIRDMEGRSTATTSGRYLALPTDFIELRRLRLISGANNYDLQARTPFALDIDESSGIPGSFAITSQIEFDKTPSSTFTVEMQYWKKLNALSSDNTSNSILTKYPQLYLYGSLYHMYTYTEQLEQAAIHKGLFETMMQEINSQYKKASMGAAPSARVRRYTP